MANGVFNWTFNEVVAVLKENGFVLNHIEGSHYYYTGSVDGKLHQVCVPRHGSKSFKPRTFKGMMLQSGLSKSAWGL